MRFHGTTTDSKHHIWRLIKYLGRFFCSNFLIQGLAKSGVLLTKSYVSPKCSPSRASFLTGQDLNDKLVI